MFYSDKGNGTFNQTRKSEYIDKSGLIAVVSQTLFARKSFTYVPRSRRFGKFYLFIMLLTVSLTVHSQSIPLDSVVAFYRNADIGSYKEKLYKGMKEYDCWLEDTFPKITQSWGIRPCLYSPSKIDIREHDAIHFVALNYYNMEYYDEKDNIYDHIILDSTKCLLFVPLDAKGKLLGITEAGDHYTYKSFTNKDDIDYQFMRQFYKHLKTVLKTSRKYNAEALVALQTIGSKYHDIGFVKDGHIYFCWPDPVELNEVVQQDLKDGKYDLIRNRDIILLPEYRESIINGGEGLTRKTRAGHSEEIDLRTCK